MLDACGSKCGTREYDRPAYCDIPRRFDYGTTRRKMATASVPDHSFKDMNANIDALFCVQYHFLVPL